MKLFPNEILGMIHKYRRELCMLVALWIQRMKPWESHRALPKEAKQLRGTKKQHPWEDV